MGSPAKKKACKVEDRISALPDELIHKIYSFLEAKQAVQSSVLSKRWELIWTTLPFLYFNRKKFRGCLIEKFIQYAILHNVEYLDIRLYYTHEPFKLSTFSSKSLKKLTLQMELEKCLQESDYWDLPALTTFHLKHRNRFGVDYKLHESWLTTLPALGKLTLEFLDLSETSFSLPNLTTLVLNHCKLPRAVWHLPALLSLLLEDVHLTKNMSDMFSALVNLKYLTLILEKGYMEHDHLISCPLLLNLNIRTHFQDPPYGNIVVSCPELCNFSCFGIFLVKVVVPELEIVNIKLNGWFNHARHVDKKNCCQWFTRMLSGLGTTKNLSFDLESIESLSEIINIQASISSPFINLKYVKLPKEYKESSISSALRSYLLGGCPRATIFTSLAQNNRILQTRAVSVAAENVVLQEPLADPTKELGDCQYINKAVTVKTVDIGVHEQYVVENSLVDANRANQTDPLVGVSYDPVSSSKGNRDSGLWQGHEVNSDFVCLLDRIMHKYPKTFEHFTTKIKKLCTMNLNMLCTSLNDFTKISMTEVSSEMIVEYRGVFAYLQNQGFDVSWLVNRLNYIEHLKFSNPLIPELHAIDYCINDAKSKLQDLQALRKAKMTEIQNAFGTLCTHLAAGSIGDDLLSGS